MTLLILSTIVIESKLKKLYKFIISGSILITVLNLHLASILLFFIPFIPTEISVIKEFFKKNLIIKIISSSVLIFIIYRIINQLFFIGSYGLKFGFTTEYGTSLIAYIILLISFAYQGILDEKDNIIFKKLFIFLLIILFLYFLNTNFWRYLVSIQYLLLFYSNKINRFYIFLSTAFSLYMLYLYGVA